MPSGFPADFPIYPKARLTAVAMFASTGRVVWGVEWESLDTQARLQAFFTKQLDLGDWMLAVTSTPGGQLTGAFSRRSNNSFSGTIAVVSAPQLTKILVSLASPG